MLAVVGGRRRQENRAGWMEVLIRLTPEDIWLDQQKEFFFKRTDPQNKLYSFPIFLWNFSKPTAKISQPKSCRDFPPQCLTLSSYFNLFAADLLNSIQQVCMYQYQQLLQM